MAIIADKLQLPANFKTAMSAVESNSWDPKLRSKGAWVRLILESIAIIDLYLEALPGGLQEYIRKTPLSVA